MVLELPILDYPIIEMSSSDASTVISDNLLGELTTDKPRRQLLGNTHQEH